MTNRRLAAKAAYGLFFAVLIPWLLVRWSAAVTPMVSLPAPAWAGAGPAALGAGLLLQVWAMALLWTRGKGLPMNAFPPAHFVSSGPYRLMAHPIYTGFVMSCFGASLVWASPGGFWIVSPLATLGCAALVYGYENPDLKRRFGEPASRPLLSLPAAQSGAPALHERLAVMVLVLLPWLFLYQALIAMGVPSDAFDLYLPVETRWPVQEWTAWIYAGTYPFVVLVPVFARTGQALRRFAVAGLTAIVLNFLLLFTLPVTAPPRAFNPATWAGHLLLFERSLDTTMGAFPSFHTSWAVISAAAWAASFPSIRWLAYAGGAAIAASCITTGMHALADVAAGALTGWLAVQYRLVWETIRNATERVANSWREWRIGRFRLINHGGYAGAGVMAGVLFLTSVLPDTALPAVLVITVAAVFGAGLWAQVIEGSSRLLRPYGYYGGLAGGMLGCAAAGLAGFDSWVLLGAFALTGPLVQAAGRLRCLVQGCCHGCPAPAAAGICYRHPRSRVVRLTAWAGLPIHPTPLYSIVWNLICAAVLFRLWTLALPAAFLAGLYLILNSLGRFVEESFRGEPQTPLFGALHLYHLLCLFLIALGAFMTVVPSQPVPFPASLPGWAGWTGAAGAGLLVWMAMGLDLPDSSRRFSRLT